MSIRPGPARPSTYHVNEVPLRWIIGADLGATSSGTTLVSIALSNGSTVELASVSRDRPEHLVDALNRRADEQLEGCG